MSGFYEVVTWLVYAIAAVIMIAATAGAILFGLALRFVAEFLRELGDGRGGGETQQHTDGGPRTPVRAKDL